MKKIVLVCVLGMFVTYTNAHSGGTNKQGCHTNSKNR
ncbi:YHYH domain-containing protein [Acinetobacter johnsonii]